MAYAIHHRISNYAGAKVGSFAEGQAFKAAMYCINRGPGRPIGLRWRSSSWFVTFVVALGVAVDLVVYSIITPVIPFQLEKLGHTQVSALAGWLLFCYSAGSVISTIPVAWFTERYKIRQSLLIWGILILVGSQIMFMLAPHYAVMCVARIIQGVGSCMVWVVGFALLKPRTDSAPEALLGTQLGITMGAFSIGVTVGPPVGGALYARFGFHAPFIFGIICCIADLIFRLIVIERKVAIRYGHDPAAAPAIAVPNAAPENPVVEVVEEKGEPKTADPQGQSTQTTATEVQQPSPVKPPPLLDVLPKLLKQGRTSVSLFVVFVYGILFSSLDPTVPLHLNRVWDLDPGQIGLVFLGSVIPTFFSGVLSGIWVDKSGTEWPTFISLILAVPWWVVIVIESKLALFITTLALGAFFASAALAPVNAELAAVARDMDGVGYGHVYGAFNLIYGIGAAVGPIMGGQIYAHSTRGWLALSLIIGGCLFISAILSFFYIGKDPLWQRMRRSITNTRLGILI